MDEDKVPVSRSCGNWLVQCRFIPLVLLASIAESPITMLTQQYAYQRYAKDAGLTPQNASFQNNTVCIAEYNKTGNSVQDRVQQKSSYFNMYLNVALMLPAIITTPLWGALSDIIGRKVPIIVASIGNCCRVLSVIFVVVWRWPLWITLVGEILHGMMGYHARTVVYITAAYVADNCPERSRTFEMMLVDLWLTIGMMIGSLLSGYFLKDVGFEHPIIGYAVPMLCVGAVDIFLIGYTIFVLPNSSNIRQAHVGLTNDMTETGCRRINNVIKTTVKKSFIVLFHSVNYREELIICAVVFCLFGAGGAPLRENLSTYVMGYPLCWRALQQSIYKAVQLGLHGCVSTAMTLLWQRKLWTLEWLLLLGLFSAMLQEIIIGLASSTLIMYVAVVAGSFSILVMPTVRSIATDMVHTQDTGALMAGLTNMENVTRLLCIVSMNFLYTATIGVYEGIVFFVSALFYIPCFPLTWRIRKLRKKHNGDMLVSFADPRTYETDTNIII